MLSVLIFLLYSEEIGYLERMKFCFRFIRVKNEFEFKFFEFKLFVILWRLEE